MFNRKKALISPEYEIQKNKKTKIHTGRLVPIYPETSGITSKWLRSRINYVFPLVENKIKELLPQTLLKNLGYPNIKRALRTVHFPINIEESALARERLAFDELLLLQLKTAHRKSDWDKNEVIHKLNVSKNEINSFIDTLPFKLTSSQTRSIDEILKDLEKSSPMNRLLEGDVGSGKTVVAAVAAFVAFVNGHQTTIMAPTQILASQHFETLKKVFEPFKVRVSLVTSAGIKAGPGKADVFVGTHALIYKKVALNNVALVVIDEQHKFGVEQRARLVHSSGVKSKAPHVLTMTATPIPRTVALAAYGDLDLSTLDELPPGRQTITSWVVPPKKREKAYNWVQTQIKKEGVQAFIICPLIEESDKETMKQVRAATKEYEELKKVFSSLKLGLLHGKLKAKEKDDIMQDFKKRRVDILIATPVVEVGIDVPNATVMIIEGAERFGLAQLHQLRGRVGRGKKKSYCLLFTDLKSTKVKKRLSALQKNLSGFELAEIDLQMRGPGEVLGTKQHGFAELKVANWQDTALVKAARNVANEAIEHPKKFSKLFSLLKSANIAPN